MIQTPRTSLIFALTVPEGAKQWFPLSFKPYYKIVRLLDIPRRSHNVWVTHKLSSAGVWRSYWITCRNAETESVCALERSDGTSDLCVGDSRAPWAASYRRRRVSWQSLNHQKKSRSRRPCDKVRGKHGHNDRWLLELYQKGSVPSR